MRASCSLELPQAFLLGEEHVKKLCKLLDDRIGRVEIKAACTDQLEREFKDAADLAKYENTKASEINRIRMTARSENWEKSVSLVFCGDPKRTHKISLDITADDGVVLRLKADVLDVVSGTRPWFSSIAAIPDNIIIAVGAYTMLPIILLLIPLSVPRLSAFLSRPVDAAFYPFALLLLGSVTVAYFAILWGFQTVFKCVFPRSVFLLGQGIGRYRIIEFWQWGVVIGFFVSLAASILLTMVLAIAR